MQSEKHTPAALRKRGLSADAIYLGGTLFHPMTPGIGSLTFHMRESAPSPRTKAALDELVAANLVSVEPFNQFGGFVYKPLIDFQRVAKAPSGKWPITVPITLATGAHDHG